VDKLLRKDLKFEGLTFTDAMEMKGAVKNFPPGEAMVQAILAGNDVLETFIDVPIAFQAIKDAVNSGRISMKILDTKVKKILMAKSWIGLDKYKPIEMKNLVEDLNSIRADVLNHQFAYESITCLKNDKKLLPINDLTQKIAVVSIEGTYESDFLRIVKNYTDVDYYHVPKEANDSLVQSIVEKTAKYDVVLVGVHLINIRASSKYGLTPSNVKHISKLAIQDNVVISLFGNPFILGKIPELAKSHTLLMAYQMTQFTESAAAQAIFGAIPTRGRLPISLDNSFNEGMGINLLPIQRLAYGVPELVGIDRVMLENRLDSVVNVGLNANAYPGCVLQVTKDNMVIFQKAY
nr:glycoside hydrolase family 3 N-terminal domain-containing protein [Saprospiraceae bacterium]